jgi:PAS domain-containing protein
VEREILRRKPAHRSGARPAAAPRDRVRSFFLTTPAGLAILDAGLRFLDVNDALARLTGRPRRAHRGRTVRDVAPGIAPAIEPILQRGL